MADTTDPKPGVFWGTLAELVGEVPVVGKALKFLLQRGGGRALVVVLFLGWTFLVYPLLVLLGRFYVRRAERNEQDFAELVDITERPPGGTAP